VRDQNAWFKAAVRLAKIAEPTQQAMSIAMAKGTGLYPRDLLFKAMSSGIVDLAMPDGRLVTRGRYFRETIMFQGARLQLDAPQALTAGGFKTIIWPLPVLDTAGFWNIAAPTRLTIPAGIEVVDLSASWVSIGGLLNARTSIGIMMNGSEASRAQAFVDGTAGQTTAQLGLTVVPGDYFEARVFSDVAGNMHGDLRTTMALTVRQAT
jgi:hypothetical protein